MPEQDFTLTFDGSIFLLTPMTEAAREWVGEHLPEDAAQWYGATVIEHRFVQDIVQGIVDAGLTGKPIRI